MGRGAGACSCRKSGAEMMLGTANPLCAALAAAVSAGKNGGSPKPNYYISRGQILQSVIIFPMLTSKQAPSAGVRWLEVDDTHSGQRLDNFLLATLKGVPRSRIYRLVRTGEVRINKGRRRPDYRLREGDIVRIPPVRTRPADALPRLRPERERELEASVIYEDEALLVLNKPSGMAAHGGSGIRLGAIESLRLARPQARQLELVHRLDRETSGCLMVAKKRSALRRLHEALREGGRRGVDKRYLALVRGVWQQGKQMRVSAPLLRNVRRSGERVVTVADTGKASETLFRPLRGFRDATLVELGLLTGRTHQARVHAAHIGHPIAGDEKYGDADFNRMLRAIGLRRLFLHAASLEFLHPVTREKLRIEAPLPAELQTVLEGLEKSDE